MEVYNKTMSKKWLNKKMNFLVMYKNYRFVIKKKFGLIPSLIIIIVINY